MCGLTGTLRPPNSFHVADRNFKHSGIESTGPGLSNELKFSKFEKIDLNLNYIGGDSNVNHCLRS